MALQVEQRLRARIAELQEYRAMVRARARARRPALAFVLSSSVHS